MTSENSDTCARFRLVMNAVRRPAPDSASSGYTVAKREMMTNATIPATSPAISQRGAVICMPSDTKNSVRKKSRSGSVLAETWML